MALATLDQAKQQLSVIHSHDDMMLSEMLDAASGSVLTYLNLADDAELPPRVEFAARQATLILVAEWYKNREAEQQGQVDGQWGYGYLPQPVVAILYPHRDPAVA